MDVPSGKTAYEALGTALEALWLESGRVAPKQIQCDCGHVHPGQVAGEETATTDPGFIRNLEITEKLSLLRELLTVRGPEPFPKGILEATEATLRYANAQRPRTDVQDILPVSEKKGLEKLALWKGDITTLKATAIVNAANSALLGCFKPDHPCIDNAIHAVAGPRLRLKCADIISELPLGQEGTGGVQVTEGYLLPAEYVLHTVGPIVHGGQPTKEQEAELKNCYVSCLDATEGLETSGPKTIVFCCISTGMFGYPPELATEVAISAVMEYFDAHPASGIQKVIFNVFTAKDFELYLEKFRSLADEPDLLSPPPPEPYSAPLQQAIDYMRSSDALLIFAGAGLSASYGLDYTSQALFKEHFPGTAARTGARCLYHMFGYTFRSEREKWEYYFSHLEVVGNWPLHAGNRVYDHLKELAERFGEEHWFVRTSNADGLFRRHGFDPERISTPQGDYSLLQCRRRCTAESVFASAPFVEAARPFLDLKHNLLSSDRVTPKCPNCGGPMFLCVRADHTFNDIRFRAGERRYREFLQVCRKNGKKLLILEIGAGFNTPSVLRYVSEALTEGQVARMIRVGVKGSQDVDWYIDGAVGVEGDAGAIVERLMA